MSVAPSSPAVRPAWRTPSAVRAGRLMARGAVLLALGAAACGGGGDGPTPPGGNDRTATLNVAVQLALAPGTGAVTMRVAPAYDLAAGGTTALTSQTVNLTAAATQQVPLPLNIGGCLDDAARTGGASAGCPVRATLTLLAGERVVDTETIGPVTLTGGGTGTASVSFVEVPPTATVTIAGAGGGSGRVTSTPAGIDCVVVTGAASGACTASFASNTSVTLTAQAAPGTPGSRFTGWGGDCASAGATTTCSVQPTAARNVTATFAPLRLLTVALPGSGAGAVTSTPAGIDCRVSAGTGCTAQFDNGTAVTLTAAAGPNATFAGWSGACSGTGACTVTMDQARSVSATFTATSVNVTLQITGGGAGTLTLTGAGVANGVCTRPGNTTAPVTCTATAAIGASLTLGASAPSTSSFVSWAGACAAFVNPSCTFTAGTNSSASARFEPVPLDPISVTLASDGTQRTGKFLISSVLGGTFLTQDSSDVVSATSATPAEVWRPSIFRGARITLTFRPTAGTAVQAYTGAAVCPPGRTDPPNAPPNGCTFTAAEGLTTGATLRSDP